KKAYVYRWPKMDFQILGPWEIDRVTSPGEIVVSCTLKSNVANSKLGIHFTGSSDLVMKIHVVDDALTISSEKEKTPGSALGGFRQSHSVVGAWLSEIPGK